MICIPKHYSLNLDRRRINDLLKMSFKTNGKKAQDMVSEFRILVILNIKNVYVSSQPFK